MLRIYLSGTSNVKRECQDFWLFVSRTRTYNITSVVLGTNYYSTPGKSTSLDNLTCDVFSTATYALCLEIAMSSCVSSMSDRIAKLFGHVKS